MTWTDFAQTDTFRLCAAVGTKYTITSDAGRPKLVGPVIEHESFRIGAYTIARVARAPRVVKLDRLDAEALENSHLSLTWAEYRQPYPTVVVELPTNYAAERVVPMTLPLGGKKQHCPALVILDHQPEHGYMMCYVVFDSGDDFFTIVATADQAGTLEEAFGPRRHELVLAASLSGTLEESAREREVACGAIRVALNAALLLVNYGCRELPERKKVIRARRYAKRHKLKQPPPPRYYAVDQNIKLYK